MNILKILPTLIMAMVILPTFGAVSPDKSKKTDDANPTVILIKDGVRKTVPFSRTEKMNPDSIESVSVKNDTIFIQLKASKSAHVRKGKSKK